jgi:hypothetical protein
MVMAAFGAVNLVTSFLIVAAVVGLLTALTGGKVHTLRGWLGMGLAMVAGCAFGGALAGSIGSGLAFGVTFAAGYVCGSAAGRAAHHAAHADAEADNR